MDVNLPLSEMIVTGKLRAMGAPREDLTRRDERKIPAWHPEILHERRRQAEAGEAVHRDWEEAKERLFRRAHENKNL